MVNTLFFSKIRVPTDILQLVPRLQPRCIDYLSDSRK